MINLNIRNEINGRNFLLYFVFFVFITIIGCVSHECGHYVVARMLGYEAKVHYASTSFYDEATSPFLQSTFEKYHEEIESGAIYPGKDNYERLIAARQKDGFYIALGGPLETHLVSFLSVALLLFLKQKKPSNRYVSGLNFVFTGTAVFILRQPVNLVMSVLLFFLSGSFPRGSDEAGLSYYLGLPWWFILVTTAIIGILLFIVVVKYFVPSGKRATYVSACFGGGVVGYFLWLYILGPVVLP